MPAILKLLGKIVLFLAIAFGLLATIVPRFLDRIYYRGPASGHFDGARFFNPGRDDTARPPGGGGRAGFFWRNLTDDRPPWPAAVPVRPSRPAASVEGARMVATWVGHATVLVQTNGLNILTDPVWAERASPFGFMGPRRVAAPGIRFADLPPIDLVLLSHNHYDHMDLSTLKRLWDRDRPVVVTSLGNDALLRGAGIPGRGDRTDCGRCPGVEAVDWNRSSLVYGAGVDAWRRRPVGPAPVAEVHVVRNHHWGSRWFTDRNRALWSAFVVRTPAGGNLFFAGDTGLGDGGWPAEAARLGPIRLALLPIGAFRFTPGEMASASHIGPVQAALVHQRLGASTSLPIHWGTFRLSYEAYATPPALLRATLRCTGQGGFPVARIGQPVDVPPSVARTQQTVPPARVLACLDTPAVRALR